MVIGCGVALGGSGGMTLAIGATVIGAGLLLALGQREWLAEQTQEPAMWMLGIGCYGALATAAMTLQTVKDGGSIAARLLALPGTLIALALVAAFAASAAIRAWGLSDPMASIKAGTGHAAGSTGASGVRADTRTGNRAALPHPWSARHPARSHSPPRATTGRRDS